MLHARARAHQLHAARSYLRGVTHRVFMRERAFSDEGENFHVPVRVWREATAAGDAVVVEHAQVPPTDFRRIIKLAERKRVVGIQPVELEVSAFSGRPERMHDVI